MFPPDRKSREKHGSYKLYCFVLRNGLKFHDVKLTLKAFTESLVSRAPSLLSVFLFIPLLIIYPLPLLVRKVLLKVIFFAYN